MENNKEGQKEPQLSPDGSSLSPIFEEIEETAKKHNIKEFAFAFVMEGVEQPLLFWKNDNGNHYYEAAALLAAAIRDLKAKIIQELDC